MLRARFVRAGALQCEPLPDFKWTDWCLGVVSERGSLALGGIMDEERIELFDAQVYTKAFDMSDPEGDYELSIRACSTHTTRTRGVAHHLAGRHGMPYHSGRCDSMYSLVLRDTYISPYFRQRKRPANCWPTWCYWRAL